MTPTARLTCFALAFICAATACHDDDTAEPAHGSLTVTVTGLSAAQSASITVTGPGQFSRTLGATTTLTDLVTGTYTVVASAVTAGSTSLSPTPATQQVTVTSAATATANVAYAASTFGLTAQLVVQGLASADYVTAPPNDPRLFIVEQPGRIRIVKNGAILPMPFLDVISRVTYSSERGLLSMAFDPAFASNGRFYIYYTGAAGDIFVDRYTVSANPDVANETPQQVITIPHRDAANHNGGLLMFGPDGMLYMGTGDGGGAGDQQNNAQNLNSLLGKILRLDVTNLPYSIPAGNPFVNQAGADEIWAYGLRNPWRYTFDGQGAAAKLYIADVGQDAWEEVNVSAASAAGVNYGWHTMEGTHCFNPSSACNTSGLTLPIFEYGHNPACSITGGFVYHGAAIPEAQGLYFYSDFCTGGLRSFRLTGNTVSDQHDWNVSVPSVKSFGLDGAGELYIISGNDNLYKVVRQ